MGKRRSKTSEVQRWERGKEWEEREGGERFPGEKGEAENARGTWPHETGTQSGVGEELKKKVHH